MTQNNVSRATSAARCFATVSVAAWRATALTSHPATRSGRRCSAGASGTTTTTTTLRRSTSDSSGGENALPVTATRATLWREPFSGSAAAAAAAASCDRKWPSGCRTTNSRKVSKFSKELRRRRTFPSGLAKSETVLRLDDFGSSSGCFVSRGFAGRDTQTSCRKVLEIDSP